MAAGWQLGLRTERARGGAVVRTRLEFDRLLKQSGQRRYRFPATGKFPYRRLESRRVVEIRCGIALEGGINRFSDYVATDRSKLISIIADL